MVEGARVTPARHAALCTCAPARMVAGAFCRHPEWKLAHVEGFTGVLVDSVRLTYQCTRCRVEVIATSHDTTHDRAATA